MPDDIFLVCDLYLTIHGERDGRVELHCEYTIDVASEEEGRQLVAILQRGGGSNHYYKGLRPNRLMRPNDVIADYRQPTPGGD